MVTDNPSSSSPIQSVNNNNTSIDQTLITNPSSSSSSIDPQIITSNNPSNVLSPQQQNINTNNTNNNLISSQPHQNTNSNNNLQRTPSVSRLTQIQQFNTNNNNNNTNTNTNTNIIYGKMNFGNGQQQQQSNAAGLTRSNLMGQTGHLTMLPGQAAAAAAQINILASPRQKAGLVQGSQYHPGNTPGQSLQGMQMGMNMMGNAYNMNPQIRPNGSLAFNQQRMNQGQMRPQLAQQLSQQNALASGQKMQAQGIARSSFMNSQMSALSQNSHLTMMQNSITQQQWPKQMPAMSTPNSPSFRMQQQRQQALMGQQLSSSQLQNSMSLNQQQLSQMAQQQHQQQQNQQQQIGHQQQQSSSSVLHTKQTTLDHPKINSLFRFNSQPSSKKKSPPPPPPPKNKSEESQPQLKKTKTTNHRNEKPLSERMRPRTINEIVGQDHLLAPGFLRSAVDSGRLPSFILWGPPGTGKTSIGRAIVNSCPSYRLVSLSAVTAGVKDVRDVVDEARKRQKNSISGTLAQTVLFVDEVHRFNKSQLDSFLPVIEDGTIIFVGATTENPSFHLITPLLSRCRVLTLNLLQPDHVSTILRRAVDDPGNGLTQSLRFTPSSIQVSDQVIEYLSQNCDGDARVALNALEISAVTCAARLDYKPGFDLDLDPDREKVVDVILSVTMDDAKQALQSKHLSYDKDGEQHYNLISALHKSMRGSDADASIYWLARMLEGGEQPLCIARRLIQFASEDVGLADTSAITQAVSCYQACHFLGMPECDINLAQCVVYLALAPKSVAVWRALGAARKAVKDSVGQNEGVPLHLRNAPTGLMKELGYGKGYIYPPDNPSEYQSYLPVSLQGSKFLHWPDKCDDDR